MTTVSELPTAAQREAEARAEVIADLRRMADWLEANPAVPIGTSTHVSVQYSTSAYMGPKAAIAEVDRVASLLDIKPSGDAAFYEVLRPIGRTTYVAVAVDRSVEADPAVKA